MLKRRGWRRTSGLPIALALAALSSATPATAAVFVANVVTDGVDATPGDGVCATAQATCTVRAAVQEANALEGPDRIELPSSPPSSTLYALTINGNNEDAAASGDLDITDDLVIQGRGGGRITVDATATDRIFEIMPDVAVELSNFMIQNGNVGPANGGGIRNQGDLLVHRFAVNNCNATNGAGIANVNGGNLVLTNVTLSSCDASGLGGGVANLDNSTVTLVSSTLANNTASAGGGIHNLGTVTLLNTLLSNVDGGNCAGREFESLGNNLESSGNCFLDGPGDLSFMNPALGNFQYDGSGNTPVYALPASSPAVDAGSLTTCPTLDQRNRLRPADGDGNGSIICDIGAYELGALIPTPTPSLSPTLTITSTPTGTLPPSETPTDTATPTTTETPTPTATASSSPTQSGTPTQTATPSITGTLTPTPPVSSTPTTSPTLTSSPTPTATVDPPRLVVANVEAPPGTDVDVEVVLRTGSFEVSSASADLTFDALNTPFAALPNGTPDCLAAAGLGSAFRFRPPGCSGTDCTVVRAQVLPLSFPFNAIEDGTVLLTCRVAVPTTAALATYPITISEIIVGDLQANPIAGASGTDGEVRVVENVCPGDCDGTGAVTVDEIVRIVSIALGTASIDTCTAADIDGSGSVTVDEIVTAVSNALNGCS